MQSHCFMPATIHLSLWSMIVCFPGLSKRKELIACKWAVSSQMESLKPWIEYLQWILCCSTYCLLTLSLAPLLPFFLFSFLPSFLSFYSYYHSNYSLKLRWISEIRLHGRPSLWVQPHSIDLTHLWALRFICSTCQVRTINSYLKESTTSM